MATTVMQPTKPAAPNLPAPAPRGSRAKAATVRVLDATQLAQHVEGWQKLAANSIVPNPFYEPWMVLPALEYLGGKENLHFLLVFGPAGRDGVEPLWGFFPLELQRKCLHLPIRTLAFWHHRYCFLTTPLIDADRVWEVLDAFWRWFEKNPLNCHLLDTSYLLAEGRFHQVWSDFVIGRMGMVLNEHPRASQTPTGSFESYLSGLFSPDHRNENRRKQRRLSESGAEYAELEDSAQVDSWVDDFVQIEAAGWKGGPEGDAFKRRSEDVAFLRAIMRGGFAQGRVSLLSLRLNGKPVAMRSVLLAGSYGFAFKSAYDESYSKLSPGLLLVLEHLRRLFAQNRIRQMDTCTMPRHPMHDAIAGERRMIRRMLLSNGSGWGDFLVSALPALRWLRKRILPSAGPEYLQISTRTPAHGGSR